jgi:hypothetical protein
MGNWLVQAISATHDAYDTSDLYGTNFRVQLLLSYTPQRKSPFSEPPLLDWHEKIVMVEHHKLERWGVRDQYVISTTPVARHCKSGRVATFTPMQRPTVPRLHT